MSEFWRTQIEILHVLNDGQVVIWIAGRPERSLLIKRYMISLPDKYVVAGKILHAEVNLDDRADELIFKNWEDK